MKLIEDNIFGILARITLGFEKSVQDNGIFEIPYKKDLFTTKKLTLLQLLLDDNPSYDLYGLKNTIGPSTISLLKLHADELRNKANASFSTMSSSSIQGIKHLNDEAKQVDKFAKQIKEKYSSGNNLEPQDSEKLLEFWDMAGTLKSQITFTKNQLSNLKMFITKYIEAYADKELEGQERLPLPNYYANAILSGICSDTYIQFNGTKRLLVSSLSHAMFCHSIMLLDSLSKIEIIDLRSFVPQGTHQAYGQIAWEAVINNLVFNKVEVIESQNSNQRSQIIADYGGLKVLKHFAKQAYIQMDGCEYSKFVIVKRPWFKVFMKFIMEKKLTKREIEAAWNVAEKGKYGSKKINRGDGEYSATIVSQIKKALRRNCPCIAQKLKFVKHGESYVLEVSK